MKAQLQRVLRAHLLDSELWCECVLLTPEGWTIFATDRDPARAVAIAVHRYRHGRVTLAERRGAYAGWVEGEGVRVCDVSTVQGGVS